MSIFYLHLLLDIQTTLDFFSARFFNVYYFLDNFYITKYYRNYMLQTIKHFYLNYSISHHYFVKMNECCGFFM